jgi:hypothetical protein
VAVESIPIYGILKGLIRNLPVILYKWYYTSERLSGLVYCDLFPRGESAEIDLGQLASARISLQIINLSPFPMEIDRAQLQMNLCGANIEFIQLRRTNIEPGAITQLFLNSTMQDSSANAIASSPDTTMRAWLNGALEINCKVRNFQKVVGLPEIRPTVINIAARKLHA